MSLSMSECASIVIGIVSLLLNRTGRSSVHGLDDFLELGLDSFFERPGRMGFQNLFGFLVAPRRQVFFPLLCPPFIGGPGKQSRRPVFLEMAEGVLARQVFAPGSHLMDEVEG